MYLSRLPAWLPRRQRIWPASTAASMDLYGAGWLTLRAGGNGRCCSMRAKPNVSAMSPMRCHIPGAINAPSGKPADDAWFPLLSDHAIDGGRRRRFIAKSYAKKHQCGIDRQDAELFVISGRV